ncbi:hypothetical protein [Microbacterium sp. Gd 4-13]|nr:hypothetical protein [Microbacterium sp. Gd 4-13]
MAVSPLRSVSGSQVAALTSPQALEDFEQELIDPVPRTRTLD